MRYPPIHRFSAIRSHDEGLMKLTFSGTRVLILGGSCHLALGLAASLLKLGLYPLLTYRDGNGKSRIQEQLKANAAQYTALYLDLSSETETSIEHEIDQGIAYLVDLAQEDFEGLMGTMDRQKTHAFFKANIAGRAVLLQRIARQMLVQRRGRMVYVSSTAAGRPHPGQGFYAAAKCGTEALYRNLGLELASRGVTTVTLRPGYIDAGRGRRYLNQDVDGALERVPMKRALTIAEIVDTISFLLSDCAVGFNATALTMDGGLSAGK